MGGCNDVPHRRPAVSRGGRARRLHAVQEAGREPVEGQGTSRDSEAEDDSQGGAGEDPGCRGPRTDAEFGSFRGSQAGDGPPGGPAVQGGRDGGAGAVEGLLLDQGEPQ